MPKFAKYLLIGSTEAYCGKSATVLGLSYQLQHKGLDIAYGKPLGTSLSESSGCVVEEDVQFIAHSLNLPKNHELGERRACRRHRRSVWAGDRQRRMKVDFQDSSSDECVSTTADRRFWRFSIVVSVASLRQDTRS